MILLEIVLKVVIGVMVMEVDKMANEVTDMEVDKVTDMKIPIEDLTYVILAIGDIYRDDVRSGRQVGRHTELIHLSAKSFNNASSATCWPNLQLMQVAPPGGQNWNQR